MGNFRFYFHQNKLEEIQWQNGLIQIKKITMVIFDIGKSSISFGLSSLATNVSNVIHFQNYSLWVTFEYIFFNLSFPLYCIKDENFDRQKRIKKDLKQSINAIQFYQFSRGNNVSSNQVIAKIKLGFLEQLITVSVQLATRNKF